MTQKHLAKNVAAKLDLLCFPAPVENPLAARCLNCSAPLALHQPDEDAPARLLGVCEQCKYWFLIDLLPELSEGILVRLPGIEMIRELSYQDPSDGISLMSCGPGRASSLPPEPIDDPG